MKRSFVLALGLVVIPSLAAAQVEIGIDAGLSVESIDDVDDNITSFSIPTTGLRVGFGAGEMVIVESRLALEYASQGDFSLTALGLVPGVNVLLGEQFYLRGEAGLLYLSEDDSGTSDSATQYVLGGAAGLRMPLVDNVIFRAEAGVDRWLENTDELIPASWEFRVVAGLSAVIN